jgi:ubiquitin C-terminal hydrolase
MCNWFFSYTFYGAVGYSGNHYVAYIRRSNNKWEMHNDLFKKITVIKNFDKLEICPHLLVYIQN